jgi:hypothetical protein
MKSSASAANSSATSNTEINPRGHDQRGHRRAMAVDAGQANRHVVGLGWNAQDLGGHQRPCEIGAKHRHDHTDADEYRSPRPDNGFQHSRHRGLADAGQFALRHHAIRHQCHHRENAEHTQKPDDGCPADVLSLACIRE